MSTVFRLLTDTYVDSVVQLSGTRAMRQVDGVEWAAAAMATPANLETLAEQGFDSSQWSDAGPNDLFLAVRAAGDDVLARAEEAARTAIFSARGSSDGSGDGPREQAPRTLDDAVELQPGSNVAVISVPGEYAALEAHRALTAGLDVLLFSDNVPVEQEVELKARAERLGHLVMGPGAGTAMLGGTCLGFANVVAASDSPQRRGRVAVVAAAGTGAQEAAALLDRWGVAVPHVIGLGGRDLTRGVGGIMARVALRALARADGVDAVLLVSKPPDPDVAREVVAAADGTTLVAALIGMDAPLDAPAVTQASTLETGVTATLAALGLPRPEPSSALREAVAGAAAQIGDERRLVRGLYSGGTLCYEALVVLGRVLGPVYSNTPIEESLALPAPEHAHVCLDLGEEEYTQGRPHPMIDPEARIEVLREQGADPEVAAIILDVVLGHGAHADPASELAPVCAQIAADGGPRVVVYVLGTEHDPQGFEAQRQAFTEAGAVVTETAARAALAAAAIATRTAELTETAL